MRAADGARVRFPLAVAGWTFRVQVMLSELRLAPGEVDGDAAWDMAVIAGLQEPLLSVSDRALGCRLARRRRAIWRSSGT